MIRLPSPAKRLYARLTRLWKRGDQYRILEILHLHEWQTVDQIASQYPEVMWWEVMRLLDRLTVAGHTQCKAWPPYPHSMDIEFSYRISIRGCGLLSDHYLEMKILGKEIPRCVRDMFNIPEVAHRA